VDYKRKSPYNLRVFACAFTFTAAAAQIFGGNARLYAPEFSNRREALGVI
jgi:hypothetical protein